MIKRGNAVAAVLVLSAAGWMGACGGGDDGGPDSATLGLGGGSPDDTREAYCDTFAKEFCAARTKCCDALPPDGLFSCEQSVSIDCNGSTTAELRDGWVFSGERIDAAIGRLRTAAASCGAYRLPERGDPFAPQEVALGGNCTLGSTSEPCASGQGCVSGRCAVRLAEGADCSTGTTSQCVVGLYCGRGVCQPVAEEGEACLGAGRGVAGGCVAGLSCVPTDTNPLTGGDVCAGPQAVGEPCTVRGTDCASGVCSSGRCVACTTDASCGVAGGRCTDGVCSVVFDYCSDDPSYYP